MSWPWSKVSSRTGKEWSDVLRTTKIHNKKEVLKGGKESKESTVGARELPEQCGQQLRSVRIYWDIYKFCGYDKIWINQ